MRENPVKALWAQGKPAFGTWCTLVNHPRFMKLLAACGLDFVILETEHTDFTVRDVSTLAIMAREAGIAPIVRPAGLLSPHVMTRALDAGAMGLLLPNVTSADELDRVLRATKYYPRGERILNFRGPHTDYLKLSDPAEQIARGNAEGLTVAMIETQAGLDALEEICAVPDLDGIMVGPDDLSQALGVPGEMSHPLMRAAFDRVAEVCTARNVPFGWSSADMKAAEANLAKGLRWMPFANDAAVLFNAFSGAAQGLKSLAARD
ncbi:HpcH/HpaI aldolase family protein [Muricoccus radiodurans]|uniref:HpcH/HpaI aldolase family protein n=1 Tax=Muricoccus radiodurans TaxID=2231721 RepID=UPI003CF454F6